MKKMQGSDYHYRPITFDDYNEFFPDIPLPRTIRGIAFIDEGSKTVGIAGVEHNGCYFSVFSNVKDDIIIPKQSIWRASVIVMDMVKDMKCDVYAISDECKDTAPRFLKRLGFRDIGGVYKRSCE